MPHKIHEKMIEVKTVLKFIEDQVLENITASCYSHPENSILQKTAIQLVSEVLSDYQRLLDGGKS